MKELSKEKRKFLTGILKPYTKFILLFVTISLCASVFDGFSIGMLVPLLGSLQQVQNYEELPRVFQVICKLVSEHPIEKQILFAVGYLVLAVVLKNIFLAISGYIGFWLSCKMVVDIRSQAVDTLMKVGIGFYNKTKAGHLVEKVVNNTHTINDLIRYCCEFAANSAAVCVLMILLLIFSWKLTLVTLVLTVFIGFGVSFYLKRLPRFGSAFAKSSRELTGSLQETISGMEVIKSFMKERVQSTMLKEKIAVAGKDLHRAYFGNYMVHLITEGFGIIAIGLLFLIAMAWYDFENKLLLAQLLPFIYILTRLMPVMKTLNQARGNIMSRWPFLNLVHDLIRLDNKPIVEDGHRIYAGMKKGIYFKSVTFSYEDRPAVENLCFMIPVGKTTAIVGKSGAGKSTIISLLLRFYDPQKGSIYIDNEPLKEFKKDSYRCKIGVVSQDTFIFNDTAKNNIAFGALDSPKDELIAEAAEKAGAHNFIMGLPKGYETILGDRGVRLSGGERQRISIARAILRDPEILILDEATSSLDMATEELIHKALSDLSRDRTVIIIAHRLSTIRGADQIIVLRDGKVAEVGKEIGLMRKKGEYYKLANATILDS